MSLARVRTRALRTREAAINCSLRSVLSLQVGDTVASSRPEVRYTGAPRRVLPGAASTPACRDETDRRQEGSWRGALVMPENDVQTASCQPQRQQDVEFPNVNQPFTSTSSINRKSGVNARKARKRSQIANPDRLAPRPSWGAEGAVFGTLAGDCATGAASLRPGRGTR
jgi:hypothetical protein